MYAELVHRRRGTALAVWTAVMPAVAPRPRLSVDQRREHLLNATTELIREQCVAAVTMDRVKDRANVSRSLLYNHFDNVDDLLFTVFTRLVDQLDQHIVAASSGAVGFEAKVHAAVQAQFEFERTNGAVFGELLEWLSTRWLKPASLHRMHVFEHWMSALIAEFGLPSDVAGSLARVPVAAIEPLIHAWRQGQLQRATAQALATRFVLAGLREAANARAR